MDITAAAQEHRALVSQRNELAARFTKGEIKQDAFERDVKPLDSRIGHLAQAFNPRIAEKAKRWFATGAH